MADVSRLTLALGLALGLHALLLFVTVDWRYFHPPASRRFDVVLLPPAARPNHAELRIIAVSAPDQPGAAPETAATVVARPDPPSTTSMPPTTPSTVSALIPAPPIAVKPMTKPPSKIVKNLSPPSSRSSIKAVARPAPAAKAAPSPKVAIPTRSAPVTQSARWSVSSALPTASATPPARLDSTALLGQIARLDTEASRRANVGIRSKRIRPTDTQSPEGFYIAAWLRKVERIGENNFPEVARRLNLSVGPVLDVAIGADGALREVRVARSSGNAELDRAAQKIVRQGDPYAPFPPELHQKWDVLHISRPWRFEASGQLQLR